MAMVVLTPVEVEAEVGDGAEKLTLVKCGPHVDIGTRTRRTYQRKSSKPQITQRSTSFRIIMSKTWNTINYRKKCYHGILNIPAGQSC